MSIYFIYIPSPIIEVEVLYTSPRDNLAACCGYVNIGKVIDTDAVGVTGLA